MADVCYNTDSFPALIRTLKRLFKLPTGALPLALMAYKERDPEERAVFQLAKKHCGVVFELVGTVSGLRGEEIEIYVGRKP